MGCGCVECKWEYGSRAASKQRGGGGRAEGDR